MRRIKPDAVDLVNYLHSIDKPIEIRETIIQVRGGGGSGEGKGAAAGEKRQGEESREASRLASWRLVYCPPSHLATHTDLCMRVFPPPPLPSPSLAFPALSP
jgi:hypothetical protein